MSYDIVIGRDGEPRLLLAGATVVDPDTKSGNPAHEISTGRFGNRPRVDRRNPQGVDRRGQVPRRVIDAAERPDIVRRRDAVADAAREIQDLSNDRALRAFIRQRWSGTRVLEEADVQAFIADAHRQRLADVTDALYGRVRRGILSRDKTARIDFPRGWLKGSLRGLTDEERHEVLDRLRVRGVTDDQLKRHITSRFGDEGKRLAQLWAA